MIAFGFPEFTVSENADLLQVTPWLILNVAA